MLKMILQKVQKMETTGTVTSPAQRATGGRWETSWRKQPIMEEFTYGANL